MTAQTLAATKSYPRTPAAPGMMPGLLLTALIAAAAFGLREIPDVGTASPLILAIVLGMLFHNAIGTPACAREGVTFALRRILRFAIILLGLQLTAAQIAEVGRQKAAAEQQPATAAESDGVVDTEDVEDAPASTEADVAEKELRAAAVTAGLTELDAEFERSYGIPIAQAGAAQLREMTAILTGSAA